MGKVKVYRIDTGEMHECEGVDARERCIRGGWSMEPVVVVPTEPVYTAPAPAEVAAEPVPLAQSEAPAPVERKKPGRKPRSA